MKPAAPIRITLQMLYDTFAKFPVEAALTQENKSFFLAAAILKHYFGPEWVERHFNRPGYLQIDESSQASMDIKGLRIIDLAEVIYNLQHVPNFDDCIERMKDGDIEGTAAELDLGRMLFLNKVPFRYIVPQSVKTKDYDVEITYPDGTVACADAKCAIEHSDMTAKGIFNKLEKARKQLPSDKPGIIFVKMPQDWLAHPAFVETTITQAKEMFRQSRRIVSIKFYVSTTTVEGSHVLQQHAYKELSSPETRFGERDWSLFQRFDPLPSGGWMPAHWQRLINFPDGPRYVPPPSQFAAVDEVNGENTMSDNFRIAQIQINDAALKMLPNRQRNQIVMCMHAHNELAVMNRILLFSLNDVGEGDLHDHAQGVQMWCLMQLLTGKLFETWTMIYERFLKSNPVDPAIAALSDAHQEDLACLRSYFSVKETALRIIRDKTGFHYDRQLNLDDAIAEVTESERRVYLAQHPANGLYYLASSLVFRTVFAMIADSAGDTTGLSQIERMAKGVAIALADIEEVNVHLHNVLYGLIAAALESPEGAPLADPERILIPIVDAPSPKIVALPMFIDIGSV
jgi:hypothetical protein